VQEEPDQLDYRQDQMMHISRPFYYGSIAPNRAL
jgi:hypothetical protein